MDNKFGLSRHIPESIKELVRRRDGFGCVRCGSGLYTYEHFNPPFKDAQKHDPDGIALLCWQCQGRTTKGVLSKETIQNDVKDPCCKRRGYSNDFFDLMYPFMTYFGNFSYFARKDMLDHVILKSRDELILGCSQDPIGGPMQLSAIFRDRNNQICLEIVKNEWRASTQNWDVKYIGKKLKIYEVEREIGIEIEVEPPDKIYFNSFITYFDNCKLLLNRESMIIEKADGNRITISTPIRTTIFGSMTI